VILAFLPDGLVSLGRRLRGIRPLGKLGHA